MTATFEQAVDDILTVFKDAWDTTGFLADYENVKSTDGVTFPPTTQDPWARVTVRHSGGGQASLADTNGTRRWNRTGIVTVQIFTPLGEGLSEAQQLGKLIADAYEGMATPRRVWFRNVRMNEVGPSDEWFQTNVVAEFTYDEVK